MALPTMRFTEESGRRLPRTVSLTKSLIERLTCSQDQRVVIVYDTAVRGLCVHVTKSNRSFYLYRKVNGRPIRMKLGAFPDLSVENARKAAQKHIGGMIEGKDPREERRSIRQSVTLQELFERWEKEHAGPRHTYTTKRTDKSRFDTCFEDWKTRKLATIKEQHVRAKHTALAEERGKVTANRAVQLLRRLFNFARVSPNPAGNKLVDFFPERARDRFLLPDELPRFFAALKNEPNQTLQDFIYACLWTGQRRNNVASMRWDELDLDRATWTIPGMKTKNHEPQRVHLAPPVLELLKRRKADADQKIKDGDERYGRGHVFPSSHFAPKIPYLAEPKTAWERLLKRANLKDLRIHDLRRSLGSWAAITGASLPVIGKALGHLDQTSTAIYARLNLDPVRVSVDAATAAILAASKVEQKQPAQIETASGEPKTKKPKKAKKSCHTEKHSA